MVKLEDGSEIEVALNKEDDAFAIFPATPADVSSIKMISKVGEEETTYEFAASESKIQLVPSCWPVPNWQPRENG